MAFSSLGAIGAPDPPDICHGLRATYLHGPLLNPVREVALHESTSDQIGQQVADGGADGRTLQKEKDGASEARRD